jgi:hypothetical protein
MSYYAYLESMSIACSDPSFEALLMAAIRRADTENYRKLSIAFPDVVIELQQRYNAPGGELAGDVLDDVLPRLVPDE